MKKFLSLVLALVMTMSLVTVSAGAKDFSDDDSITYQEAVDVISEIGVVDGYTGGDFKPTDVLTRGAAAKIICNLILGPTTASALSASSAPFKDVPVSNTFAGYITYCAQEKIINGYPDGTVKPTGDVTRAEVAAILYRVMDADCVKTYETTRCSFSDVVRGDWFNLYVATLEDAGVIVDTRTNGKFRPNDAITRAELASMIAQFAGLESASAAKFNDVGSRYWAAEEIAIAAKMGWINGYPDGSFRPDATITRAEMMAMINRALGRTPKSADDLLSGMKTWRDNANVNAWYYLDVQEATNSHTYTKSGTHETWKKLR